MSTQRTNLGPPIVYRAGTSVTLAISGVVHAGLYVHGYRHLPTVGPAFLLQASVFVALAVLIAAGGPRWLRWAAVLSALASLTAFALSRTVGVFGFIERGWDPSPQAAISVVAELLTVALCLVWAMATQDISSARVRPRIGSFVRRHYD
jgi:hypothetical protein